MVEKRGVQILRRGLTCLLALWFLGLWTPSQALCQAAGESGADSKGTAGQEEMDEARILEAAATLQSPAKVKELLSAMEVLRKGFPESREALHQCAARGSHQGKAFALRILGEVGEHEKDAELVQEALSDTEVKVRRAAVMAIRKLGRESLDVLLKYLPRERDPNNRKMAIKTLQHWGGDESLPILVTLLRKEKDRGVRNFLVTALQELTKRKFGDDVKAWESYLDTEMLHDQAQILLERQPLKGKRAVPEVKR